MIAPDSATVTTPGGSTGDVPSGWIARQSGGGNRGIGSAGDFLIA